MWQPCELLYTCYLLTYLLTSTPSTRSDSLTCLSDNICESLYSDSLQLQKLPPRLMVDVQKLCNNVCAFIVMELCTAVNASASGGLRTLDPLYRPIPHSPAPVTKSWRRHCQFTRRDSTRQDCSVASPADVNRASLAVARARHHRNVRRGDLFYLRQK